MKECPFCGEMIQDKAIKCRFCAEWLEKTKDCAENDALLTVDNKKNVQNNKKIVNIETESSIKDNDTNRIKLSEVEKKKEIKYGIKGLLTLFIGTKVLGTVYIGIGLYIFSNLLYKIYSSHIKLSQLGQDITNYIILILIIGIIDISVCIIAIILTYQKKPIVPKLWITYIWASYVINIVMFYYGLNHNYYNYIFETSSAKQAFIGSVFKDVIFGIILNVVWTIYFVKSKRVKNTFRNQSNRNTTAVDNDIKNNGNEKETTRTNENNKAQFNSMIQGYSDYRGHMMQSMLNNKKKLNIDKNMDKNEVDENLKDKEYYDNIINEVENQKKNKFGIKGWLLFFVIVNIIILIYGTVTLLMHNITGRYFVRIEIAPFNSITQGYGEEHLFYSILSIIVLFMILLMTFQKTKIVPKVWILYMWTTSILWLIFAMNYLSNSDINKLYGIRHILTSPYINFFIIVIISNLLYNIIWTTYFVKSNRVKNTFVNYKD